MNVTSMDLIVLTTDSVLLLCVFYAVTSNTVSDVTSNRWCSAYDS